MKIIQALATWTLYTWSISAQEAGNLCESITVTRVSQEIPCATIDILVLDPDLSGTLEINGIEQVRELRLRDNTGLESLGSSSLTTIETQLSVFAADSLREIVFPNLTSVGSFSVLRAPELRQIMLGNETSVAMFDFEMVNTAIERVDLVTDWVGSLNMRNNTRLQWFFSEVREIGSGRFEFNGDRLVVSLQNLVSAAGLSIRHTEDIRLPSLVSVNSTLALQDNEFKAAGDEAVRPNPLQLPSLETVSGLLSVTNNTNLFDVNFPQLKSVGGSLWIISNSAAEEVNFPQLDKIGENLTVTGNLGIADLGGFPLLTEVSNRVMLEGDFVFVEMPNLSNAAGGLWVSSSENISYSCARLEMSFQSNRPHQSFECRSAGDEWASGGDNTTESNPGDTDPGQNQDGEQMAPAQPLSGGAIAGIVIGALAAVGILAAVLFIVRRRRRKGAVVKERSSTTEAGGLKDPKYTPVPPGELQGVPRSELAMPDPELEGSRVPKDGGTIYYEVDGTTRRGA